MSAIGSARFGRWTRGALLALALAPRAAQAAGARVTSLNDLASMDSPTPCQIGGLEVGAERQLGEGGLTFLSTPGAR